MRALAQPLGIGAATLTAGVDGFAHGGIVGDNAKVEKTLTLQKTKHQAAADLAYWLSRPMAERIAAVEVLRLQAFAHTPNDAEQRLQRVCRVTQRQRR
jgi:hypothetical protein